MVFTAKCFVLSSPDGSFERYMQELFLFIICEKCRGPRTADWRVFRVGLTVLLSLLRPSAICLSLPPVSSFYYLTFLMCCIFFPLFSFISFLYPVLQRLRTCPSEISSHLVRIISRRLLGFLMRPYLLLLNSIS